VKREDDFFESWEKKKKREKEYGAEKGWAVGGSLELTGSVLVEEKNAPGKRGGARFLVFSPKKEGPFRKREESPGLRKIRVPSRGKGILKRGDRGKSLI